LDSLLLLSAVTLGASSALVVALRPVGYRFGLLDWPGGRKTHDYPTPMVGGVAVYLAVLITTAFFLAPDRLSYDLTALLSASAALVVVGVIDDKHQIDFRLRFALHVLVALFVVVVAGCCIVDLGALLTYHPMALGAFAVPFTVFALVGAINAINMTDGMDGLAGSVSALSLTFLGIAAMSAGRFSEAAFMFAVVGGILGFLVFNVRCCVLRRARVFLGDSGATFLGLVTGYFLILLSQGEHRAFSPVAALWILGVPLLDTVACMLLRIVGGSSPFHPDRRHIHHLLLDSGFTVSQALLIIIAIQAILGAAGLAGSYTGVPDHIMFSAFIGVSLIYLAGVAVGHRSLSSVHGQP
jgi:UDP-GlcNAc:undecaprenyl-phosphate GlcNAc-1-phosphate transferase